MAFHPSLWLFLSLNLFVDFGSSQTPITPVSEPTITALTIVNSTVASATTQEAPNEGRILHGHLVPQGKYSFMASIQIKVQGKYYHNCGGTILNDEFILTAAHCNMRGYRLKHARVLVGTVRQEDQHSAEHYFSVATMVKHEKYGGGAKKNKKGSYLGGYDVAVIKLKKRINFSQFAGNAAKVCLPTLIDQPVVKDCIVIGWGKTEQTASVKEAEAENELRWVDVVVTNNSECFSHFPITRDDIICTDEGKMTGSCHGDSGGPFVCPVKGDSSTWLQFGINSFGPMSCRDAPGVYTNVSMYTEWIEEQVEKLGSPKKKKKKKRSIPEGELTDSRRPSTCH